MDPLTSGRPDTASSAALLALGLPGVILSFAVVLAGVASAAGIGLRADDRQLTLAEAAALHDIAEIVRLVRAGHDPRQPAPVRAGIIREQAMVMTPMAAAILERRVDVIALLEAIGARIRPDEFGPYWCLAQTRGDAAVIAAVASQVRQPAPVDCSVTGMPFDAANE